MPPQKPRKSGRARAIALSLLLHSAIVAAAVYGWFTWKHKPPPPQTLAIEGAVVDERALKNISPAPTPPAPAPEPAPEPEPTPAEPEKPPEPDPAEVERQKEEERLAAEKLETERIETEKRQQEEARLDAEKKETERLEAEKQAAAKAAAEKVAAEKAAAEKKALEKKRADDAAAAKKAAEEKARLAREAELRRSLEEEERGNALRNSDLASRWHAQIIARIQRAWIKPPSARPGVTCIVLVRQVPGGDVTSVRVASCNGGDDAFRESIEAAVYRASPLPPPPDPALFQPGLELTFAPE